MLIVENGQGIVNADSYVSTDEVAKHCTDYGYEWQPAQSNDSILRNATKYIDFRYRAYMTGKTLNSEQGLCFPRTDATYKQDISDKEVFSLIKQACCEVCVLLSQDVQLFSNTNNSPILISKSLANGAISSKWDVSNQNKLPKFSKIDAILYPLFGEIDNTSLEPNSDDISIIQVTRG